MKKQWVKEIREKHEAKMKAARDNELIKKEGNEDTGICK